MIIGTRSSKLALLQTEKVNERLKAWGYEPTIKQVRSLGDVMTDRGLYEMPEKGVFVKKLDIMLLEGKIDLAVHSMKDIPLERDEKLETSAVLPRDSPFDALVSKYKLAEIPDDAVIGTSSVRRKLQFLQFMDANGVNVKIKDIRGNVDTRIRKLRSGDYDGVLLAEAGLERLNLEVEYERLDCDPFVPSPNQGIIAVVTRRDSWTSELISKIDDPDTRIEAEVETDVLKVIGGGCALPVGVHASCNDASVGLAVYIGASREAYILETGVLSKERCRDEACELANRLIK
ncbi:MAG: hydroxymethylbilane synthase [Halobacteriota archaeon]